MSKFDVGIRGKRLAGWMLSLAAVCALAAWEDWIAVAMATGAVLVALMLATAGVIALKVWRQRGGGRP